MNGISTNPTPVRAELPTIKSPAGVNLALPPPIGAAVPFALNVADFATNDRRRESVRKYIDTPGTFL